MSPDRRALWASVALAAALAIGTRGCLSRRDGDSTPSRSPCTSCHGSESRVGSDLLKAAPPFDLAGSTSTASRGVGAHQIHLSDAETHALVACEQCHTVPKEVASPGHADTTGDSGPQRPADVPLLGALAGLGGRSPSYDPEKLTCTDTYCHREAQPRWTEPRSSSEACGSCHGLPPPAPHPQKDDCVRCHGSVVDANRQFIRPELHVNGTIDTTLTCHACHGSPDSSAPPVDLAGNTDRSNLGVGAHQPHLAGGQSSRPLECGECHSVPSAVSDPGHIDQTPHAEVTFTGVAKTNAASPVWDREAKVCKGAWCHGPDEPASSLSPEWTTTSGPLGCTGCHGKPPPPPHPQLDRCSLCHAAVIAADNATIQDRSLHVNGAIDVQLPEGCSACHGSPSSPAPPSDVAGNTATTARGVGAHQTHVQGTIFSRPVPCEECHVVPASILAAGHMDSARPAELNFSGVAISFSAQPSFDGARCNSTYCHGDSFYPSGGTNTKPQWTAVDQGETFCGSCHGMPPPPPHIQTALPCSGCHINMNGFQIIDRNLHIDGLVQ
jgi:predicted CxxxxCH...CXXCH cytochrome family protein